jgi:hypothetical protein
VPTKIPNRIAEEKSNNADPPQTTRGTTESDVATDTKVVRVAI